MSLIPKLGLGFAGLAGVSGAGYLGFRKLSQEPKESFKTKYSLAVKGFLSDDAALGKKLEALGNDSSSPKHPDLISAKTHKKAGKAEDAKTALKKGCADIHDKPIDSGFLDDFRNYCSFNNGDKLGSNKTLVASDADLANKKEAFKNKGADQLQKGFKNIGKPAEASSDTSWQKAVFSECTKLSTEIFEGEISNFMEFCSK
ncbi:hypothetical protein HF1_09930 [Mycoplasma haemofelis str. Langford 1]|uniref:Uncharacterized protein n=1 Tax=Mycoplasma haemofelis (strain Langford 1) TaxID=941640 RepID=E8ZIN0_MYCHL|nr:hypothetical protein [Mycoplasma haemofelis]CBY93001.1 hypothetical protein HF1_09930 [Mycoplasma haemofelis str. Langford 1]